MGSAQLKTIQENENKLLFCVFPSFSHHQPFHISVQCNNCLSWSEDLYNKITNYGPLLKFIESKIPVSLVCHKPLIQIDFLNYLVLI